MTVMTTGNHPKALWPGVKAWYGVEYNKHPKIWPQLFETRTSDQSYEEIVETTGFGLLAVKSQGGSISYDTASQGATSRFVNITYGLGYIVTMEELQDNLYEKVSNARASRLARSVYETEEVTHANVFNRAFNPSYTGGDGKELLATDHPTMNGSQSNELATPSDLNEAAVEDLLTQIADATDSRGLRIMLKPMCLAVSNADQWEAIRILNSALRPGTANNDVNAIKHTGALSKGAVVNPYFTDPDAWFIPTDAPEGLLHFNRMAFKFDKDTDFNTKNALASVVGRYSHGHGDWRGLFGSSGS